VQRAEYVNYATYRST